VFVISALLQNAKTLIKQRRNQLFENAKRRGKIPYKTNGKLMILMLPLSFELEFWHPG